MTETATASALPQRTAAENAPHAWGILATILTVASMDILDGTVVNVAIPEIRADLGTGSAGIQWIVGGYALTFAIGLIAGGRLGDIYGRKRMFMLGVVLFTLTSLACGLAPSTGVLILTRMLQGFAAAVMIPQGFGLIRESFSEEDLPKALAFWGPSAAIAALSGPIVGGLLIDLNAFDSDWRGVFLVNVPIGIAAFYFARRLMPDRKEKEADAPGLDLAGAAIMGLAVGLIFFPLIEGRELDWPLWIFGMFAAGFAVLGFFAWFERRREDEGKSTLIVTSIFQKPSYLGGTTLVTLLFCSIAGLLLVMTLYLQIDQGFSAIHAGLTLIPWALGTAIGAVIAGALLMDRIGRHTLHIGIAISIVGVAALLLALDADGENISSWNLAIPLLILGLGSGLVISPSYSFALSGIEFGELGSGSGVLSAMQQLGTATGVAVIGTVFFSVATDQGMLDAIESALFVIGGLLVVIAASIFLLPMRRDHEVLG